MEIAERIRMALRGMITQLGFPEDKYRPGFPIGVPEGDHIVEIDGELVRVQVVDGRLYYCSIETGKMFVGPSFS